MLITRVLGFPRVSAGGDNTCELVMVAAPLVIDFSDAVVPLESACLIKLETYTQQHPEMNITALSEGLSEIEEYDCLDPLSILFHDYLGEISLPFGINPFDIDRYASVKEIPQNSPIACVGNEILAMTEINGQVSQAIKAKISQLIYG